MAYFGTASFAVPALRMLASSIELVVSQPDRPSGRGLRLSQSPVKAEAEALGLRVVTPEKSRDPEFVESIRAMDLDMLLVAAYGQILSQPLLDSTRRGAINMHGSILPKYRGAAPIQRCILAGDAETGVTLMQMDRGMDTGDIIASVTTYVGSDETYGDLECRLGELAAQMAAVWTPQIESGDYPRYPQNESEASYAPKVTRDEAELVTARPALLEYNRYRAFTPAPGAWMATKFGRLRILEARFVEDIGPSGTVIALKPELVIGFLEGSLTLRSLKPEGRGAMSGSDWANGLRLKVGDSIIA